jgi:hypothetical protein
MVLEKRAWLHAPAWLFETILGEQSQLILNGQFVTPKHLTDAGFIFHFQNLRHALNNLKQAKRPATADL